jgi:hypothetical protein
MIQHLELSGNHYIAKVDALYLVRDGNQWLTDLFSEELFYSGRLFADRYFSGGMER